MAFYKPLKTISVFCFNIRPKLCDYAKSQFHGRPFCSFRNETRNTNIGLGLERKLCYSPMNLLPSINPNTRLIAKRYISTARTLLLRAEPQGAQGNTSTGVNKGTTSTLYYITALGVVALGLAYAAVPLYRIFCQAYSYGGTTQQGHDAEKVETMTKVEDRVITVRFNADTAASMTWNFRPQQHEIKVVPGETALAFYTARNPTNRPVIGVSTYNVVPFDAGQYFNKIQCFCFEEQLLNPHEEVHMPVFFYIDPEFADDPKMENTSSLTLSYTFFEVREGVKIPIPNFARN